MVQDTDLHEVSILHRVITYYPPGSLGGERVEFQADPRHAELIVKQCNLDGEKTKGVVTPSIKLPVTKENQCKLDDQEAEEYRSITMRLGYLSLDRSDLQYASREYARGMAGPTVRHLEQLKRAARYLLHAPSLVWVWRK